MLGDSCGDSGDQEGDGEAGGGGGEVCPDGEDCGEKVVKIIQNLKKKDKSNKIKFLSKYDSKAYSVIFHLT